MILSFNKQTLRRNRSRRICKGATFLCIITATLPLSAQTAEGDSVINRNITIEREYRPVIQDAGKINTLPHFAEPKVSKISPQYTTNFSKPLNVEHNIHYLSSAELSYQRKENKEGFARVGVGTGFNSLADFAYPLLKKPDMKLDFRLNHYGLLNRKAHSNTQATLAFDKQFNAVDFFAGVSGGHEYYKYYGTVDSIVYSGFESSVLTRKVDDIDQLSYFPGYNHLWRMNAHAGIRTSPTTEALRYGVALNYDLFNSRQGITEHAIRLDANIDGEVGGNRLGVDISSQNMFYASSMEGTAFNNFYILSLNPYYSFEKEAFDLRLGLKADFLFGKAGNEVFNPALDIHFEWRTVPRILSIYAGAGGDFQSNTLNEMYKENCFIRPDLQPGSTHTPVDLYFGVKVKPVTGLLIDLYVDYKYILDQYFFVNQGIGEIPSSATALKTEPAPPAHTRPTYYLNRFDVGYSDAGVLKTGGRISYNYHNKFNIQLCGAYNHWSVHPFGYAWYKPAWEMDLNTNVRITPKLNVYANAHLEGKRYAEIGDRAVELKPIVDINLGASYDFLDWLSAFLKVNNLINNKYELWHGYEAQGFNVMAGATFSF